MATAVGAALVGLGAAGYLYFDLRRENSLLKEFIATLEGSIRLSERVQGDLAGALQNERDTTTNLSQSLQAEQAKNSMFESQIQSIAGTVGTLKKLSETDKELLQKYSKVYFLSENYVPSKMVDIPPNYLMEPSRTMQFHADALPFLMRMMNEAGANNMTLQVVSAYRSFYDQISVKSGHKLVYGSGANQFSADQGYSEHQLATTVDFTTPKLAGLSLQLEKDPAYQWLAANAYRFGFILSYPKNNSYYQFEPWHWRFVGVQLATRLHNEGKSFYDLTQREIDAYLISIFD